MYIFFLYCFYIGQVLSYFISVFYNYVLLNKTNT